MAKQIENLRDLFLERTRELYEASLQVQRDLPLIRQKTESKALQKIIEKQILLAKKQSAKLIETFEILEEPEYATPNLCCKAILKETKELIDRSTGKEVIDAIIVESIQRLNHSNISTLGSLAAFAMEIGERDVSYSLHQLLEDEKEIDKKLSELAINEINRKAVVAI